MRDFSQVQGGREVRTAGIAGYFEDLPASGGLKFEPDAEIGQKGLFMDGN
jgi:hypothetical protein